MKNIDPYKVAPAIITPYKYFNLIEKESRSIFKVNKTAHTHKLQKIAVEKSRLKIPLLFGYLFCSRAQSDSLNLIEGIGLAPMCVLIKWSTRN